MFSEKQNSMHYLNHTILSTMRYLLAKEHDRALVTFHLTEETALWIEQLTTEDLFHIAQVDHFICDFNNTWKTLQVQTKLPPNSLGQKAYALLNGTAGKKSKNE